MASSPKLWDCGLGENFDVLWVFDVIFWNYFFTWRDKHLYLGYLGVGSRTGWETAKKNISLK